MLKIIFIALFFFAGVHDAQQTKPAPSSTPGDVSPALEYSQRAALFLLRAHQFELEQQRDSLTAQLNNLDGQLASIAESEKAVGAEYARQHPGWRLDDKFQPIRNAASPARHAEAAGQK